MLMAMGHHRHSRRGVGHRLRHLVRPHSHESGGKVDAALEAGAGGMRALWVSLGGLGLTTAVQAAVVAVSGSVALLGDTLHNGADALTAVPLAIAFLLARRAPTRRYTYGYGRAEDLAGIVIVEVHGETGAPPYLIRWSDGHESLFFPSADTVVEHHPKESVR